MEKSYKMRMAIKKLIKKYGFTEDEISYGVEICGANRYRPGYFDYAILHCPITRLHFVVSYDGNIY